MVIPLLEGRDLKAERARIGVKQYRIAQSLGIPPTIVCDYENGRRRLTREFVDSYRRALNELQQVTTEVDQGDRAA